MSSSLSTVVQTVRRTFRSGKTRPYEWRIAQIKNIVRMLNENKESALAALTTDLKQTYFLGTLAEIQMPIEEAEYILNNLSDWMKPESRSIDLLMQPGSGEIISEPLGVVLIISPWNYPLSLLLKPLLGALAAGNCVIIKPSEVSIACSSWFEQNIPKYLDRDAVRVITGGAEETTQLLKEEFDHIFYTGSTMVGKIIMKAAAEHLTPVTLELGGKSPCIVDKDANLDVSARRIVSGKFGNAGQTCVAPDYILLHKDVSDRFIEKVKSTLKEFYGEDPQKSNDYSRVINERHTQRLANLLDGEKGVVVGGKVDVQDRYIAPTIVNVTEPNTSVLMKDEIFGPILPIIKINDTDEAIQFVNDRPKPLALYVFSENSTTSQKILDNTSSGGASVNETIFHVAVKSLPFGGVGPSGMGSYNGKKTFDTFSHKKSVLYRSTIADPSLRYPPFTPNKIWWFQKLQSIKLPSNNVLLLIILVGIVLGVANHFRARL